MAKGVRMSKSAITLREFKELLNQLPEEYTDKEIRFIDICWAKLGEINVVLDQNGSIIISESCSVDY